MVPSYVHPDDSYSIDDLKRDSGDYGLKFDEEGNVCDSEGLIFVDENDNSWSKDSD